MEQGGNTKGFLLNTETGEKWYLYFENKTKPGLYKSN